MAAGKKSKAAATTKPEDVADDGASTSSSDAEEDVAMGEGSGSDEDDASSSSEDDAMEEDAGSDDDDDGSSGADDGTAKEDRGAAPPAAPVDDGDEPCTFDLANLVAHNTHQVNAAALYRPTSAAAAAAAPDAAWYARPATLPPSAGCPAAREAALLASAAAGAKQLLRELWRLPVGEKTDAGPLVRLPAGGTGLRLPRALPPPPPKQQSKWEKFALQRGITPKSKNSRKVFDEATGEWKHLTGSLATKANAGPESWPIIEVKKNDDPMADPWEKLRDEKKARVGKNSESRTRNAERAGTLERGSGNRLAKGNERMVKQRASARERQRERGMAAPAGVPMDMARSKEAGPTKRGKPSTQLALRATQVSTASLGKFDQQREGEPEKKPLSKAIHGSKKRRQEQPGEGGGSAKKKPSQSEAQKSTDILQRVISGSSSKEKERDVKRGKYAKGETAYDYEFDDGLGSGSFKKKKGRAGMGKMRKITKKRIK